MLPYKLQHQQLIEISIEQRPRDRVQFPVVIVRPLCEVHDHELLSSSAVATKATGSRSPNGWSCKKRPRLRAFGYTQATFAPHNIERHEASQPTFFWSRWFRKKSLRYSSSRNASVPPALVVESAPAIFPADRQLCKSPPFKNRCRKPASKLSPAPTASTMSACSARLAKRSLPRRATAPSAPSFTTTVGAIEAS